MRFIDDRSIPHILQWFNRSIFFAMRDRFDEDVQHMELDYPRDMSIWRGIGYHIDAALQWKDGMQFFNI